MKNYFNYSFILTASVVLLISAVSIIAPTKVFGVKLKQTNIYSDVISDTEIREMVGLVGSPYEQQKNVVKEGQQLVDHFNRLADSIKQVQIAATRKAVEKRKIEPAPVGVVALQDFSEDGFHLAPFFEKLDNAASDGVRIAFMGDSFIEGDIMTVDLRESFQNKFSGSGVGFVPITSQVAKFRGSVVHRFSDNWTDYSILKNQSNAQFMLSGHCFVPKSENPWVEYEGNKFKKHTFSFEQATLAFINEGNTKIKAIINDDQVKEFSPASSAEMQFITVTDSIHKVRFEFSDIEGFRAYGALLDNRTGVSVDNYSVRGNSGIGMTAVNEGLCRQMSRVAPYDLIVLEYGLNVVEEEVVTYGTYRNLMIKVVDHLKICYPGVPIIIMGVSDRSTRSSGDFVTMEGVKAMDAAQKDVARKCGIVYWSTLDAMRSMGGMPKFVEYGWAAQDYTHIGSRGGQKIAQKLFDAIIANR